MLYRVHAYREMRLVFEDVEADSPEKAAQMAAELPTEAAMEISDCDGQTFAATVDEVGESEIVASQFITLGDVQQPEHVESEEPASLHACRAVVAAWESGDLAAAVRQCAAAIACADDDLGVTT